MNAQRQQFVKEYLVDLNATRAYQAAYPKAALRTCQQNGFQLLKNTEIQEAIVQGMAERGKRTEVTADRVVRELAKIAFLDTRKLFNGRGVKSAEQWTEDEAAAVAGFEAGPRGVQKVKLWNRIEALNLLGKHLGLFTEKLHVTGSVQSGTPDLTKLSDEQLQQIEAILQSAHAGSSSG
jgi:phage terminase small subunit